MVCCWFAHRPLPPSRFFDRRSVYLFGRMKCPQHGEGTKGARENRSGTANAAEHVYTFHVFLFSSTPITPVPAIRTALRCISAGFFTYSLHGDFCRSCKAGDAAIVFSSACNRNSILSLQNAPPFLLSHTPLDALQRIDNRQDPRGRRAKRTTPPSDTNDCNLRARLGRRGQTSSLYKTAITKVPTDRLSHIEEAARLGFC